MEKTAGYFLFSAFFMLISPGLAQNQNDNGVLVSPPVGSQVSRQSGTGLITGNTDSNNASHVPSDQAAGASRQPRNQVKKYASPTDEIVVKATNMLISELKANMKLTQDQMTAVRPIIANNIADVRNLQQSLQYGEINSSAMNSQRQQLTEIENEELNSVLTPDQMKIWIDMQNYPARKNSGHR